MTERHWSDLARRKAANEVKAATRSQTLAPHLTAKTMAAERAAAQNPHLHQLMQERAVLEKRMNAAAGGGTLAGSSDPRDAVRFQVPTMAQRRADHDRWARQRDQLTGTSGKGDSGFDRASTASGAEWQRPLNPAASNPAVAEPALRATPGETPRGSPSLAQAWLQRRTGAGRFRGPSAESEAAEDVGARLDQRLGRARSLAGHARNAARGIDDKLRDLDRQFAQGDRDLAEQGASEQDRAQLQQIKKDLGLDNYTKARDKGGAMLSKATVLPDSYSAARRKVEDNWSNRRDAVGGADTQSYMRPLRGLNARVLGMGLPDMEERAAHLKAAALDKRRAAREEENSDAARRERALEKRRLARDGE